MFKLLVAALSCALLSGCAGWKLPQAPVPDVRPIKEKRTAAAVEEFEQQRTEMEYQAALSQWRHGQHDLCRQSLRRLLARHADHVESRVLLAELLLVQGEPQQALDELQLAAEHDPNLPQALHLTAIALDELGRETEALDYYRRAAQQAPGNEVYQASYQRAEQDAEFYHVAPVSSPEPVRPAAKDTRRSRASIEMPATPRDDAVPPELLYDAQVQTVSFEAPLPDVTKTAAFSESASASEPDIAWIDDSTDTEPHGNAPRELLLASAAPLPPPLPSPPAPRPLPVETPAEATGLYTLPTRSSTQAAKQPAVRLALRVPEQPVDEVEATSSSSPSSPCAMIATAAADADCAEPDDLAVADAAEHLELGLRALESGAVERARIRLTAAIRQAGDDPQIPLKAAIEALRCDEPELAVELATLGYEALPHVAALHRAAALGYYRQGQWREAQVRLDKALSLDNSDALAYFLMGSTLSKLGQSEQAERHLRTAANLDSRYALGL